MKLLMHVCCAPCSVYCIEDLRKDGIEPTLYWYNPNIHPYSEYIARRDCLKEYSDRINIKTIFEDEYGLDNFCKNVSNNIDTRCVDYCYPVRLRKTFEYAKENGYDTVTTTLLYSIYQRHEYIKKICEDLSKEYGINFLYKDFRVGYWQGHEKALEEKLYMQKYCGCVFSENPLNKSNNSKPILPDGCKWPDKSTLQIKKIKENKEKYIDYLLDADPSKEMINKYLNNSDLFVLYKDNEIISLAVISIIDNEICELKNLVTMDKYRGKGYASRLLKYLFGTYKQKYKKMIVGTSENNIPFYVKNGFDRYYKTIKNFFIDNYEDEIWDNGIRCIDIYYYCKELT